MKTVCDILREILASVSRSETGIIMQMIAFDMAYEWRC